MYYFLLWSQPNSQVNNFMLDAMLKSLIPNYGLWYMMQGFNEKSQQYKQYTQDIEIDAFTKSKEFLEFMLKIALKQITTMQKYLTIEYLYTKLNDYISYSRLEYTPCPSLPKHTELLTKELLIKGEIKRGEVKGIINREQRSATQLIYKLLELDYITTDSPKGSIRLHFTIEMAQFIFPSLLEVGV
ncbi:MAG: hypothetical protein JXQ76_06310 [Campylobacterales bacterium]|nr:hypothetical protein [Campylobacterales bacterium]